MGFAFFQRIAAPVPVTLALGALLGIAAASVALAAGASASPWIASTNSKVRLVSGMVDLDGKSTLLAGVQLRMNSGWKTYWKNPGDSGVPPGFDWSGSKNLKHAEVLYPAPHRFADANGTAIGYDDEVVFPVKLTPEREGEPIELKLAFAYGLCKDLCIPNDVSLGLALAADAGKGDALLLENFLTRVPKPAKSGALPEVNGVEANLDGEAPELVVDAVFPPGATGNDLFVDAGDVFIPVPRPLGPVAGGEQRFAVSFASPSESAAVKGKTLALTLVSDQGSTETMWTAE
ncbi:MAG: protein-disulfide reductase DsbD domain-containing protein [Methyloceanibacter sp.]